MWLRRRRQVRSCSSTTLNSSSPSSLPLPLPSPSLSLRSSEKVATSELSFWNSLENQRAYLDELTTKLGFGNLDAWYRANSSQIIKNGGVGFMIFHGWSLSAGLKAVYPDHPWDVTKFARKPRNYWSDAAHQRAFMDVLGGKFGIQRGDFAAWYKVGTEDVMKRGGRRFLLYHKNSLVGALKAVYPEHAWDLVKFSKKPQSFWSSVQNQRQFLVELGAKLGVKEGDFEGWYGVTYDEAMQHGARGLLSKFNDSVSSALVAIFSEHKWDPSRFITKPRHFWATPSNQREWLLGLGQKLGFKEGDFEAWYKLSFADIREAGGKSLEQQYGSVMELLLTVFPDHDWKLWKFPVARSGANARAALMSAVSHIESNLSLSELDDWYRVTADQLQTLGIAHLIRAHGGLFSFLKRAYPKKEWREDRFAASLLS